MAKIDKVLVASFLVLAPKGAPFGSDTSRNQFYALNTRHKFEASPDVFTGMLKHFFHDVYYLLDPGSTLSYVTPFMAVHFGFGFECNPSPFILPWWVTLWLPGEFIGVVWYLWVVRRLWCICLS